MTKRSLVPAFLVLLFSTPPAFAQQKNFSNEFGFKSDNDAYLGVGQDRYYTNGLFITYRHAMKPKAGGAVKKIWEAEIGQKMYNAQSGYVPGIAYVDRPFAAYLYGGVGLTKVTSDEGAIRFTLQAGTIGPAALGRQAQELLHKIAGFYEINGWQYQVNNEFGVNAAATWTRRVTGSSGDHADIHVEGTVDAGTTFTDASAAAVIRLGSINSVFSSALTNTRIGAVDSLPKKELFFFLRPKLTYVAYDATVQGGLFTDAKGPVTYDVKPLVFSQEAGIMFARRRWTADFSVTFLTKQLESSARAHQYGGVSLYYRFD